MEECKKIKYPTRKLALESLKNIRFKKSGNHAEKGIYLCNKCYHWHLTSQHSGVKGLKIVVSNF